MMRMLVAEMGREPRISGQPSIWNVSLRASESTSGESGLRRGDGAARTATAKRLGLIAMAGEESTHTARPTS